MNKKVLFEADSCFQTKVFNSKNLKKVKKICMTIPSPECHVLLKWPQTGNKRGQNKQSFAKCKQRKNGGKMINYIFRSIFQFNFFST
jgi:hypothetical protein